jgi:hypothetical protein
MYISIYMCMYIYIYIYTYICIYTTLDEKKLFEDIWMLALFPQKILLPQILIYAALIYGHFYIIIQSFHLRYEMLLFLLVILIDKYEGLINS